MSYILEALKKAQAERQLGGVPTIHAESLHASPEAEPLPAWRKPLWLALGAALLLVLLLLALVLKQFMPGSAQLAVAPGRTAGQDLAVATPSPAAEAPPPNGAAVAAAAAAAAPDAVVAAPPVTPTVTPPAVLAAPPAMPSVSSQMPLAAPRQSGPPPPRQRLAEQSASAPSAGSQKAADLPKPQAAVAEAATPARASTTPAAQPSAPVGEDTSIPFLRELPPAMQQQMPAVALGGYIYSKNAPDRLLLVDKVLRHEGEEVAPGLVLERLQPKSAVFNFRGSRYRIAY